MFVLVAPPALTTLAALTTAAALPVLPAPVVRARLGAALLRTLSVFSSVTSGLSTFRLCVARR
ncbi:hypothetical protein LY40_003015 [Prauserella salsuginis]|nr:hypothetical protein [Prauserella salsuginis]